MKVKSQQGRKMGRIKRKNTDKLAEKKGRKCKTFVQDAGNRETSNVALEKELGVGEKKKSPSRLRRMVQELGNEIVWC